MTFYVIYNFSLSQEKANINNIILAEKNEGGFRFPLLSLSKVNVQVVLMLLTSNKWKFSRIKTFSLQYRREVHYDTNWDGWATI